MSQRWRPQGKEVAAFVSTCASTLHSHFSCMISMVWNIFFFILISSIITLLGPKYASPICLTVAEQSVLIWTYCRFKSRARDSPSQHAIASRISGLVTLSHTSADAPRKKPIWSRLTNARAPLSPLRDNATSTFIFAQPTAGGGRHFCTELVLLDTRFWTLGRRPTLHVWGPCVLPQRFSYCKRSVWRWF